MQFKSKKLIEEIKKDPELWFKLASQWYSCKYNFNDKTKAEELWMKRLWAVLEKTIREDWKNSVNVVPYAVGFMGEDVYCVDGILTHTIHSYHEKCMRPQVLRRGEGWWCALCKSYIERESILTPEEYRAVGIKSEYEKVGLKDLTNVCRWFHDASLGYSEFLHKESSVIETMRTLYGAILELAPKEGVVAADKLHIVNGKPAIKLWRECIKCNKNWSTCNDESAVFSVWEEGPFNEKKIWCASCKGWTSLVKM